MCDGRAGNNPDTPARYHPLQLPASAPTRHACRTRGASGLPASHTSRPCSPPGHLILSEASEIHPLPSYTRPPLPSHLDPAPNTRCIFTPSQTSSGLQTHPTTHQQPPAQTRGPCVPFRLPGSADPRSTLPTGLPQVLPLPSLWPLQVLCPLSRVTPPFSLLPLKLSPNKTKFPCQVFD